jgi:hypothetical protein
VRSCARRYACHQVCIAADESERNGSNVIELRAVAPDYLKTITVLSKVSSPPLPAPFFYTDAHPSTQPTTHHQMNIHQSLSNKMDVSP